MADSQSMNAGLGEGEHRVPRGGEILDQEMFRRFLESLSPDQMSLLILSGALDDKLVEKGADVRLPDLKRSFPLATERQGFDVEEWKNRPEPKIR
jgi:hypothetical protein